MNSKGDFAARSSILKRQYYGPGLSTLKLLVWMLRLNAYISENGSLETMIELTAKLLAYHHGQLICLVASVNWRGLGVAAGVLLHGCISRLAHQDPQHYLYGRTG